MTGGVARLLVTGAVLLLAPSILWPQVARGEPPAPLADGMPVEIGGGRSLSGASSEDRVLREALERALLQRGGLLLPPWTLEIEPSLSYTHASSDEISIDGFIIDPILVIGEIVSEKIRRNAIQPALTGRLGIPGDWQAEVRVPYVYSTTSRTMASGTEEESSSAGLGDVELAVSHQVYRDPTGRLPDLLAGIRWKTTTGADPFDAAPGKPSVGTGFDAIQGSITAVKPSDPAAFFGSLSYTANLPRHKSPGRIDPGDAIGLQLGMVIALNLETSLSLAWEDRLILDTTLNGSRVPGSDLNVGNLQFGVTYAWTQKYSFDFIVSVGLTRDAPDMQATFALQFRPYR